MGVRMEQRQLLTPRMIQSMEILQLPLMALEERIEQELPKQHEIPFDSDRKRSTVIRRMPDGKLRAFTNGAPGVLLQLCTSLYTRTGIRPLTDPDRQRILAQITLMAQQALRVLGSAYCDLDNTSPSDLTPEAVERDLVPRGRDGLHERGLGLRELADDEEGADRGLLGQELEHVGNGVERAGGRARRRVVLHVQRERDRRGHTHRRDCISTRPCRGT